MGEIAVQERPAEQTTRIGRPSLYNEEDAKAICEHVAQGMTKRGACGLVGVNEHTFNLWASTRDEFIEMLARADAEAEAAFTKPMLECATDMETAKGDWRPAIEWLKRRRKAEYGDTLDIRKVDTSTLLQLLQSQQADAAITEDGEPVAAAITAEDVL